MTDLTGKQIANTYKQLLKVGVSTNSGVSTTAQTIQSGDGTNSAMQLSTTAIKSTSKIVAVSICATNDVHVGGNVCATAFFGDGAGLTNVSLSVSSSVAHFTANVLDVPACASITNLVAATGSFTTKVSGVAAEFSGNVCASEFYGDGSNLTNVAAATSVASMTINTLGVVTAASITSLVAPHGSFTTKVSGVAAEFSGIVSATTFDGALIGDVTGDVTGDIDGATGSFSACISATNLVAATGSFTTKVSGVAGEFSGTVCAATFDGALTGDVTGDIDGATGSFSACISATNLVAATGSFTTKVSGVAAEFSGNVCASEYYGDGSNLTNLPSAPTSVASFTVNQLGVVTAASITSLVAPHGSFTTKVSGVAGEFSGTVCAATFDGALTGDVTGDIDGAIGSFSACISATNLVAATGSFTTKVSGVAAEFSGNVCASEYYGDGSNLSGIAAATSVASFTVNQLGVVTAASITSLVAPYGSFTTKVSGVAGEFSGTVCAATFDGALTGDVTGDIDGATGSFSACISSTNLVAATGSFTTKVSGVAAEFSGNVCASEYYGGGSNLTGISASFTGIASDVTPDGDGTRNLGSAAAEWDQVYMRYPTLWERRLNIILLGVLNSGGTMKMFASGHSWDPASGNTTLNPDMNDSVVGDFIPEALDSSTGFNSKPAGYKASDTSTIILNTDDMGSGNYIGQVIISKQNMASTYVNLSGQFRSHSLNIGGTTIYRPEVQLWYNGGNTLNTDTTRYSTSKYAYWSVFFYAK